MSSLDPYPARREAAERVLAAHGLVLEEIQVRPRSGMPEVRLVVDLPEDELGSVDLDTVAAATSELNAEVDADDALLGPDPALLEVTTPGVDRPLTAPRHFRRARGRLVQLRTTAGEEHRARVLAVTDEDEIVLRPEAGRDDRGRPRRLPAGTPERLGIPAAEVESAQVQIEFDPPADLERLLDEATTTAPKES